MSNEINVHIRASKEGFGETLHDAAGDVRDAASDIRESMDSMRTSLSFVAWDTIIKDLGRIGEMLVTAAGRAIEFGDQMAKVMARSKLTGEAATELAYAFETVDVDANGLATTLQYMQESISKAETGSLRHTRALAALGLTLDDLKGKAADQQFEIIADRISKLKDAEDAARASTDLLGQSASRLRPLMEDGAEGIRKAREEAQQLGRSFTGEQIAALEEADQAVKRLQASWQGFATTLTVKVSPILSATLDRLRGESFFDSYFGNRTGTQEQQVQFLETRIKNLRASLAAGMDSAAALAEAEERLARIQEGRGASGGGRRGRYIPTPASEQAPGYEPPEDRPAREPAKTDRERRPVFMDEDEIYRMQMERGAELRERAADEQRELDEQTVQHKLALGQQELEQRAGQLAEMAQLGQISRQQELEGYRDLEIERFQLEQQALQRRAADTDAEVLDRQKALDEIELLTREHQERMRLLDMQAQAERMQPWQQIFGAMRAGNESVLQSAFRGYLTVGQILRGVTASVLNAFTDMGAKIVSQWLTLKIAGLMFNRSAIVGEAAKAGAAGTASFAGAPWPINMGAPAFGAAMSAAASAYMAVASAAGGFDIPAGVNPLVQTHAREMILPEKHADVIRAMAESGDRGSADRPISVAVSALDGPSFDSFLRNGGARKIREAVLRGETL